MSAATRETTELPSISGVTIPDNVIQAFDAGIRHTPATTFGNVKADVLADKDPNFRPINFCSVIRGSQWKD